ncbi:MAG: hypothetical protein ABNH26_02515 [Celeribacter sp.]|jgi:hypothetical protein
MLQLLANSFIAAALSRQTRRPSGGHITAEDLRWMQSRRRADRRRHVTEPEF